MVNRCATSAVWTGDDNLLLYGQRGSGRSDWWLYQPGKQALNLTAGMETVPDDFVPVGPASDSMLGVASGALWKIDLKSHEISKVAVPAGEYVSSILWPQKRNGPGYLSPANRLKILPAAYVIYTSRGEDGIITNRLLEWTSGKDYPYPGPFPANYSQSNDEFYGRAEGDHPGVFRIDGYSPRTQISTTILEENVELGARLPKQPARRRLDYLGSDGQDLHAWILLPDGYDGKTPLPTITAVYPGTMWGAIRGPSLTYSGTDQEDNWALFATRGYAVLYPSLPVNRAEGGSDAMLELPNGVLPALNKAVELGLTDPARVGLVGHGDGGFAVFGLAAMTNRFACAISQAGISDQVSLYGTFPRMTMSDRDAIQPAFGLESGQIGLGGPPGEPTNGTSEIAPCSMWIESIRR
jgi:hypothetical protein